MVNLEFESEAECLIHSYPCPGMVDVCFHRVRARNHNLRDDLRVVNGRIEKLEDEPKTLRAVIATLTNKNGFPSKPSLDVASFHEDSNDVVNINDDHTGDRHRRGARKPTNSYLRNMKTYAIATELLNQYGTALAFITLNLHLELPVVNAELLADGVMLGRVRITFVDPTTHQDLQSIRPFILAIDDYRIRDEVSWSLSRNRMCIYK